MTFGYQQYATAAASYGGRSNDGQTMDGNSTTIGYRYDISEGTNIRLNYRQTHLRQNYYFDNWDWNGLITPNVITATDLAKAYEGERDSRNAAFQALLDTRPFNGNQLILGVGRETGDHKTWGKTVNATTITVSRSESTINSVFLQDEQRVGDLTLNAGVRNDRIDLAPDTVNDVPKNGSGSVANVVNPRLGARYKLTDATSVYASYGTAYVPALNLYRYVQPSTTRVDNPNLKPESSKTYEVGINNRFGFGDLRAALYHTDYVDKITLGTDAASGKGQWQNIAFVKVDGVEIAYQGDLGSGWLPYSNFTYTKGRDYAKEGATGTQSIRIAPRKFNAGVTYAPNDIWSATLNARYVSELYFNNLTEAQRADAYTQVDCKVSTKLPIQGRDMEAFLAVNNLTGKKYESFNKLEWSDGRSFTVGASGKF
ncbi:MAG: TonB-dependent receptor [Sideroxydans sp.]|nr:TonB-dependent receptor [Sideroxydans sp.]